MTRRPHVCRFKPFGKRVRPDQDLDPVAGSEHLLRLPLRQLHPLTGGLVADGPAIGRVANHAAVPDGVQAIADVVHRVGVLSEHENRLVAAIERVGDDLVQTNHLRLVLVRDDGDLVGELSEADDLVVERPRRDLSGDVGVLLENGVVGRQKCLEPEVAIERFDPAAQRTLDRVERRSESSAIHSEDETQRVLGLTGFDLLCLVVLGSDVVLNLAVEVLLLRRHLHRDVVNDSVRDRGVSWPYTRVPIGAERVAGIAKDAVAHRVVGVEPGGHR